MPYGSTTTPLATFRSPGSSKTAHETLQIGGGLGYLLMRVGCEQEFPSCRPRNDHERCLWCILHILFGQVSRDERPELSMDRFVVPTRRMCVLLFGGKTARWRKASSMLGQELDSLADLVRIAPS